jgi:hypothetical protein
VAEGPPLASGLRSLAAQFDGASFHVVEYRGEPYVMAKELAAALGYAEDGKALTRLVGAEWSSEFHSGKHFHRVSRPELVVLKAVFQLGKCDLPSSKPLQLSLPTHEASPSSPWRASTSFC